MAVNEYILSCDIARKRDFFSLMLFKDVSEIVRGNGITGSPDRLLRSYDIQLIEQYNGWGYGEMADRIAVLMGHRLLRLNADLIVDGTGIGDAAVELVRKRGLYPVPVIYSGGEAPREHYEEMGKIFSESGDFSGARVLKSVSVPKKDLVHAGKILMEQGRVRAAPGRWTDEFKKQLMRFRGKVNETSGRVKYGSDTEQDHDDLVVCYLMGAWWILNRRERGAAEERVTGKESCAGWEPAGYM